MGMRPPPENKELVVLVKGKRCRIMAVSLEHITINLDNVENVAIGDRVTIIGRDHDESISLQELAYVWQVTPLQALISMSGKFSVRSI